MPRAPEPEDTGGEGFPALASKASEDPHLQDDDDDEVELEVENVDWDDKSESSGRCKYDKEEEAEMEIDERMDEGPRHPIHHVPKKKVSPNKNTDDYFFKSAIYPPQQERPPLQRRTTARERSSFSRPDQLSALFSARTSTTLRQSIHQVLARNRSRDSGPPFSDNPHACGTPGPEAVLDEEVLEAFKLFNQARYQVFTRPHVRVASTPAHLLAHARDVRAKRTLEHPLTRITSEMHARWPPAHAPHVRAAR